MMMTYEELYEKLLARVAEYIEGIAEIDFAWPERQSINALPETPEQLLRCIGVIADSSLELNKVMEDNPASVFVADATGKALRINKTFETITQTDRKSLMGRNTNNIEEDGIFKPSVCSLTMREKRRVSVLQQVNEVPDIFVTGVPIFNELGKLYRVVTSATLMSEINGVNSYVLKSRRKGLEAPGPKSELIAESGIMKAIIKLVDMIKDTESSILLTGETGVGKGVLARYIHETSNRAEKRMMEINCGAIPAALLESELFGYESGAFTGADKRGKLGLIEMSDGGTLFLDEISELPLLLQVKLLHFLQNKRLIRVGGTQEIPINTRIIAASNRLLKEQVEQGLFRSDLYYRLNVIPIVIPPLRERKEDIRPTALYFFDKFMAKYRKNVKVSEECLKELEKRYWEGNTRELENYIERFVVTNGVTNDVEELGHEKKLESHPEGEEEKAQHNGKTLKEIEKELVLELYEKYHSSYRVAEELGISQTAAYRKIKKYVGSNGR